MALIDFVTPGNQQNGDANGSSYTILKDSIGNDISKQHREQLLSTSEGLVISGKNDDVATMIRVDRKGSLLMGNYIPELLESFEGAIVNVQKWTTSTATFTASQTTLTGYNYTSGGATTVSSVSFIQSQRLFYKLPRVPLQYKVRKRHDIKTNSIADFGFGIPTSTTLIVPNGVQVRFTTSAQVQVVLTVNSVETAIANVISTVASNGNTIGGALNMSNSYYTSNYFVYDIIIDDDNVVVTVQDTSTGEFIGKASLYVPNSAIKAWGATALPVYSRVYNSGVPTTSPIYIDTELQVLSLDWRLTPSMDEIAASLRLSAGANPFTGAQLENHTNSVAPTSATLSNTTAGYTTLGGKFQFAAVAGAATDFALFGFQVPAGSRFLCTGIRINTYNTGAAVATSNTLLEWSMGFNSSAVSLATANIIRRQVGVQTFAIAAPIGAVAEILDVDFGSGEVVESGRFLHVILNLPIGTATASQVIRGTVTVKGRFI